MVLTLAFVYYINVMKARQCNNSFGVSKPHFYENEKGKALDEYLCDSTSYLEADQIGILSHLQNRPRLLIFGSVFETDVKLD